MLGEQTAGDLVIQKLSKLLTAIEIKTRQPTSMAAGEYRETHNPTGVWQAWCNAMMASFKTGKIVATGYEHIDEDTRYQADLREEP